MVTFLGISVEYINVKVLLKIERAVHMLTLVIFR